jgi:hypothetical protein
VSGENSSTKKQQQNSSIIMTSKYSLDNSLSIQRGAVREPSVDEEEDKSFSFQLNSSRNSSRLSNTKLHNQVSQTLNLTKGQEEFQENYHSSPSVKDIEESPSKNNSDLDTPSP